MTKKDRLTEGLKPLKIISDDTILPHIFDTLWDIKKGRELKDMKNNTTARRILAEHGFDVEKWLKS